MARASESKSKSYSIFLKRGKTTTLDRQADKSYEPGTFGLPKLPELNVLCGKAKPSAP